ncbi:SGNH hydrolase-type esterase domain-containing protein [Dactylonectria estremocensis]|uniref:SGNH hydrolase-type esterase domain-containing protein n=1 Tax=Dactylonectria estremocensis TaxID=1079267 RepID=A0A9P9FKR2_9HYPO|nr:SGNH hydrolase-type esterase domain-containing protein [Dactylonectria estremocensis]
MTGLNFQAALCVTALLSALCHPVASEGVPSLRILPLGDSITKGSGSSDNNGYRKILRDKLVANISDSSVTVDMVGSLKHGTMPDNDHEGHSGEYLREISTYWELSIRARPNVVLIHAGTNNMDKEVELNNSLALMENIIYGIMDEAPEAVVFVAPIIWANDTRMQANTDKFNGDLNSTILEMQDNELRILQVPIDIGLSDLSDRKHPNNKGYQKMAKAWFDAIADAHARGWLQDPIPLNASDISGVGLGINGVDLNDNDEEDGNDSGNGNENGSGNDSNSDSNSENDNDNDSDNDSDNDTESGNNSTSTSDNSDGESKAMSYNGGVMRPEAFVALCIATWLVGRSL